MWIHCSCSAEIWLGVKNVGLDVKLDEKPIMYGIMERKL